MNVESFAIETFEPTIGYKYQIVGLHSAQSIGSSSTSMASDLYASSLQHDLKYEGAQCISSPLHLCLPVIYNTRIKSRMNHKRDRRTEGGNGCNPQHDRKNTHEER